MGSLLVACVCMCVVGVRGVQRSGNGLDQTTNETKRSDHAVVVTTTHYLLLYWLSVSASWGCEFVYWYVWCSFVWIGLGFIVAIVVCLSYFVYGACIVSCCVCGVVVWRGLVVGCRLCEVETAWPSG